MTRGRWLPSCRHMGGTMANVVVMLMLMPMVVVMVVVVVVVVVVALRAWWGAR